MPRVTVLLPILIMGIACKYGWTQPIQEHFGDENAVASVARELCHSHIVMLGESATHGDEHTLAFKVSLVKRLVDQCGFDALFFEASHYEFIALNRRLHKGQSVTASQLSAAVGGLWSFDQEFQPLPPFLLARAQSGKVFLGGIDDQLGQRGQDYANVEMITELTSLLAQPERQACSVALHKRIFSDYSKASPYTQSDRGQIETCLSEIDQANATNRTGDRGAEDERQEMVSATRRWIARDFRPDADYRVGRDNSMFQDFEWLLKQDPRRHKVILWGATVHIAKRADPSWGDSSGSNFGSLVRKSYGHRRVFSLGFSALAGSYRQPGAGVKAIPDPPTDSIEAQAVGESTSQAIYIGPARLAVMGTAPGGLFRHSYETLLWSSFLDGVVIFRQEYPPGRQTSKSRSLPGTEP